jgi:hypothetical protein
MTSQSLDVTVVMVASEGAEPYAEFYREYSEPLRASGISFEFLCVIPAIRRAVMNPLIELRDAGEPIVLFESAEHIGEAGLLRSTLSYCRGDVVLILPAVRRVAATALPTLLKAIREDNTDMVIARRSANGDPPANQFQRRIVHRVIRAVVGGEFHDLGSGVRAIRRDVLSELPLYGEFSRFLPLFAIREGFRVQEIEVPQHPADRRTRIYSPRTYIPRLLDLLAVYFLIRFREKPLRFFGLIGGLVSLVGFIILVVLGTQRLGGQALADRPMLLVGVLLFVLGVQGLALGLVGEIIVHAGAKGRKVYRLAPHRAE